MANTIFFNPAGYIEVKIEGDQTYMSFQNLMPSAQDIMEELQKKGQKRLGLIDLSKEGSFTPESNRAAMEMMEALNYDKIAMFGAGRIITEVAKAIIIAMGKGSNTKIFNDREAALTWLFQEDDPPKADNTSVDLTNN